MYIGNTAIGELTWYNNAFNIENSFAIFCRNLSETGWFITDGNPQAGTEAYNCLRILIIPADQRILTLLENVFFDGHQPDNGICIPTTIYWYPGGDGLLAATEMARITSPVATQTSASKDAYHFH